MQKKHRAHIPVLVMRKRFHTQATMHMMAVRIQQRFWYARARWNTTRRIAQKLIRAGIEGGTPKDLDVLIGCMFTDEGETLFPLWLKRVAGCHCNHATVLGAFVFAMHSMPITAPAVNHGSELVRRAKNLAALLDKRMRDAGKSTRAKRRAIAQSIQEYSTVFNAWRSINEADIIQLLVKDTLIHVHAAMCQRHPQTNAVMTLIKRYALMLSRPCDTIKDHALGSKEMKVLRKLPESPFWGPGNLSLFRLMHELLMDEGFSLSSEKILPNLCQKYTPIPNTPLIITEFLFDLRAVILWSVREPEVLLEMVHLMDFERSVWPENVRDISSKLIPLLCKALPDADTAADLRVRWAEFQTGSPSRSKILSFVLEAVLTLRQAYATLDLQQCQRNIRRHDSGFYMTHSSLMISKATHTKRTQLWVQRILDSYPPEELKLVSQGNPYMLLGLHDQLVVDFVLDGDLDHAPETLVFDASRIQLIRANVGLYDRARLHGLAESNETKGLHAELVQAVDLLRKIIFVSRFQHGETISNMAAGMARQAMNERLVDTSVEVLK